MVRYYEKKGVKISKLPRLRVHCLLVSANEGDICDLEQAKHRFDYGSETLILVDGQVVSSYEELIQIATQDRYKDKQCLEVGLLPLIVGG